MQAAATVIVALPTAATRSHASPAPPPAKVVPPLPLPPAGARAQGGGAGSWRWPGLSLFGDEAACTRGGLVAVSLAALLLFAATFAASRSLSPLLAPRAYRALSLQPGQQGYWDSCVTSSLHALLVTALAIAAVRPRPARPSAQ